MRRVPLSCMTFIILVIITIEDRFLNFSRKYIIMAGTTYVSPLQNFNKIYVGVWWKDDGGKKRVGMYELELDNALYIHRRPYLDDLVIKDKKGKYRSYMGIKAPTVSSPHLAVIPRLDEIIKIVDLGSKYGTRKLGLGEYTIVDSNTIERFGFKYSIDDLCHLGIYEPIEGDIRYWYNNIVYGGEVAKIKPGKCVNVGLASGALFKTYVPGRGIVTGPAVGVLICNLGYK